MLIKAGGAFLSAAFLLAASTLWIACNGTSTGPGSRQQHHTSETLKAEFSYQPYSSALEFVGEDGLVDYSGLFKNRESLDQFVALLAHLSPSSFENWTEDDRLAFWINVYNSLTLKVILDHYPIDASFLKSFIYPSNSIRQIEGVWDEIQFDVMGRKLTLDTIEHGIIRKEFDEPRIHMALVCAAMGCPPLRSEPYLGQKLDAQLDDQSHKFFEDSDKFRIDRSTDTVYLSSILDWFGKDFVSRYQTEQLFQQFDQVERAVLNFVSSHVDATESQYLRQNDFEIEYLDYDWSLNEK